MTNWLPRIMFFPAIFFALVTCSYPAPGQVARHKDTLHWATWTYSGTRATGSFSNGGTPVTVTLTSATGFIPGAIYGYATLNKIVPFPETQVPSTPWGRGNKTTMCFSKNIKDPVLVIGSLGKSNTSVTLTFSAPFVVVGQANYIKINSNRSVTGSEGNIVLKFPGMFSCIDVTSNERETTTYLTWAIMMSKYPE